jgi:hypothetical protein
MPQFLRVTLVVAAALVALILAAFVLKIVVVAAILAAIGVAGLFLVNFVRAFARVRRASASRTSLPLG